MVKPMTPVMSAARSMRNVGSGLLKWEGDDAAPDGRDPDFIRIRVVHVCVGKYVKNM